MARRTGSTATNAAALGHLAIPGLAATNSITASQAAALLLHANSGGQPPAGYVGGVGTDAPPSLGSTRFTFEWHILAQSKDAKQSGAQPAAIVLAEGHQPFFASAFSP
jgi:hypothetical protein